MGKVVERGQTYYGADQTIDTGDYADVHLEGIVGEFLDTDVDDVTKLRSSRKTRARLMRNVSGSTVYARAAVSMEDDYDGERFGTTYTTACRSGGIIDDRLGSGGCRNGDMCWVFFEGPVYYDTPSASPTTAIGDLLYIKTDDEGRLTRKVSALTFSSTDVTDGTMGTILMNSLGRAMETSTSGETDTAKLIDLGA